MGVSKKCIETPSKKRRPATTPQGRENQLISKAMDLVERRMDEGTASSQEVTHFLKLASSKGSLENQKLQHENELLKAKTEALESNRDNEGLYAEAIAAMTLYKGAIDG